MERIFVVRMASLFTHIIFIILYHICFYQKEVEKQIPYRFIISLRESSSVISWWFSPITLGLEQPWLQLACWQALHLWWAKWAAREHASEWQSHQGQRKGESPFLSLPHALPFPFAYCSHVTSCHSPKSVAWNSSDCFESFSPFNNWGSK